MNQRVPLDASLYRRPDGEQRLSVQEDASERTAETLEELQTSITTISQNNTTQTQLLDDIKKSLDDNAEPKQHNGYD